MARPTAWSDPLYATSVASGLKVLEAFSGTRPGLTNKTLAQLTGLSPASISRITSTLTTRGLLRFDVAGGCYRLDGGALTLGHPLLVRLGLRQLARMAMRQVAGELGSTVSLGMRERADMVYIETSRGQDLITFRPDVGARLPLLQSAMGRAWLAAASERERNEALQAVRAAYPVVERELVRIVMQARAELARQGYCASRGDFRSDVHAVAVPLDVRLNGERLMLNCGIPTSRLAPDHLERTAGPRLLRLARQIEVEWHGETGEQATSFAKMPSLPPGAFDERTQARTLARAIDLLQAFQPGETSLGNGELAERLGLSGSTVVRLTHTLTVHGYLQRDKTGGRYARYCLGAAAIAVAYPLLSSLDVRERVRPAMLALAKQFHGSVSLGMRHQIRMVYVETAWRADGRLVPPDTGTLLPMLASAMGRAWLCSATQDFRKALLNQLRVQDPASWSAHATAAQHAIEAFSRLGYCWSRDARPDVEAFAVPLPRSLNGVQYVMNCGVLAKDSLSSSRARDIGTSFAEQVAKIDV
jgi:DNA-binding IclR family transcriptional regulator